MRSKSWSEFCECWAIRFSSSDWILWVCGVLEVMVVFFCVRLITCWMRSFSVWEWTPCWALDNWARRSAFVLFFRVCCFPIFTLILGFVNCSVRFIPSSASDSALLERSLSFQTPSLARVVSAEEALLISLVTPLRNA